MKANMKLAGNRSKKRMLNVVAIVFSVLQTATLSDALAYNERVYGESVTEWTCENDVTTCTLFVQFSSVLEGFFYVRYL